MKEIVKRMSVVSVLGEIVARARARVHEQRARAAPRPDPLDGARRPAAGGASRRRSTRPDRVNVIAEFKRRSPSRGLIRADLHPVRVAQAYEIAGAAALSVLTEEEYFGGSLDDLQEARSATLLPTLRKDFIVDPYQIWESWIAGTDAVLADRGGALDAELKTLLATAPRGLDRGAGRGPRRGELARALDAGARLVGVNNRDLRTLQVSPRDVARAGRRDPRRRRRGGRERHPMRPTDVRRLRDAGYDAFLVGEHLMLAPDPGAALEALIAGASPERMSPAPAVREDLRDHPTPEDARVAAEAGADAIGFVFWPRQPALRRRRRGARDRRRACRLGRARRRVRGRERRADAAHGRRGAPRPAPAPR